MQGVRRTALLAGAAQPPVLADAFAAAFLALAALPPVLANTDAAAAALLALGAQPPVLVAVAFLAPAGRQTTRAHATRSEPNVVPIKAESRFQIPKKFGDGDEKRGAAGDFCDRL